MTTPLILPEGPLTDKNGKQYNLIMATFGNTVRGQGYYLVPHVERHPLFIDLAGNPVHEGDVVYFADKVTGGIHSGNTFQHSTLYGNGNWSPHFKHKSDCEKWVASNVKTLTLEQAYRMMQDKPQEYLIMRRNRPLYNVPDSFKEWIEEKIKETCLLTKDKV